MTNSPIRATAVLALVAGGVVLVAGCGGPKAVAKQPSSVGSSTSAAAAATPAAPARQAGSSATVNPCSLFTQAEVDAAVGQPLGKGDLVMPNDCQWTTSDFGAGVDITVGDWASNIASVLASAPEHTTIVGVGDEAVNINNPQGSLLYFRKGAMAFGLNMNGPHIDNRPDRGLAPEKVLAAALLSRL